MHTDAGNEKYVGMCTVNLNLDTLPGSLAIITLIPSGVRASQGAILLLQHLQHSRWALAAARCYPHIIHADSEHTC